MSFDDFCYTINKMPLITDLIRNELFLNNQLLGNNELYSDSQFTYKFVYIALAKKFIFKFLPEYDKQDDFTIDPSQQMRIAKQDLGRLYEKGIDGSEVNSAIVIKLSALSTQDTFIRIKQRIKLILDFVVQAESLNDVPNIMSEKFQFRSLD